MKFEAGNMTYRTPLLFVAATTLSLFATFQSAEAHHRRFFPFPHIFSEPAPDYGYDNYDESYPVYEGDVTYADPGYVDDYADPYYVPRRRHRAVEGDVAPWWLQDQPKPRHRLNQARRLEPTYNYKPKAKRKATVASAPVPKLAPAAVKRKVAPLALKPQSKPKLETASLTPAKPKASKSIGCTAGAAIVTGYGFAGVTPKVCTGNIYAYNASRDGKSYLIKVTAAQGEITEVTKQ
jgi:hypothetical protein